MKTKNKITKSYIKNCIITEKTSSDLNIKILYYAYDFKGQCRTQKELIDMIYEKMNRKIKMKKYYKVLTKDLRSPNNYDFSYKGWKNKIFEVTGKLRMCRNGLHLYKSLSNLSVGSFGSKVYEAEPIGKFFEDENKICCDRIKLRKKIDITEVEDDYWIYNYCRDIKDRSELWKKLKDDEWIYNYCLHVQDRPELWKKLKNDYWIYRYCLQIKDRPELWKKLKDEEWIYHYCQNVQDRSELWKKLKDEKWIFEYCRDIQDRPELWKKLKDDEWIRSYCYDIVDRPELRKNKNETQNENIA